eukprot:scaffold192793_cov40-Cyclotella_meneghiniana.AAC.3
MLHWENTKSLKKENCTTHLRRLESARSLKEQVWRQLERFWQYGRADAFAKHFADHCRDCRTSNEVKSRIKEILTPKILWKGDIIRCMKSAMTPQCKLCRLRGRRSATV